MHVAQKEPSAPKGRGTEMSDRARDFGAGQSTRNALRMPSEETPQRRRLWFPHDELHERRRIQIHRHCGPRLIRDARLSLVLPHLH